MMSRMARFDVSPQEVVLRLALLERMGSLRGDTVVPASDIASVEVWDNPWKRGRLRGLRVGTGCPYVIVLGTMVRGGMPNDVVAVYGRRPTVVLNLRDGAAHSRIIATVEDADDVAQRIVAMTGARAA